MNKHELYREPARRLAVLGVSFFAAASRADDMAAALAGAGVACSGRAGGLWGVSGGSSVARAFRYLN
jgi:hypothetical protein